jgi:hypothetical protein
MLIPPETKVNAPDSHGETLSAADMNFKTKLFPRPNHLPVEGAMMKKLVRLSPEIFQLQQTFAGHWLHLTEGVGRKTTRAVC